ncbi:hypothetical protein VZT92_003549 [Zoarces viviparus]|uniref:Uncharacterized protein n=1 Tax=Zoarces viviparus TaxID=48416 RepID=A0AAW1FV17_ZOAVI
MINLSVEAQSGEGVTGSRWNNGALLPDVDQFHTCVTLKPSETSEEEADGFSPAAPRTQQVTRSHELHPAAGTCGINKIVIPSLVGLKSLPPVTTPPRIPLQRVRSLKPELCDPPGSLGLAGRPRSCFYSLWIK